MSDGSRWGNKRAYSLEPSWEAGVKLIAGQTGIVAVCAALLMTGLGLGAVWFAGAVWSLALKLGVVAAFCITGLAGPYLLRQIWALWWQYAPGEERPKSEKSDPRVWIDGQKMAPALERIADRLERIETMDTRSHSAFSQLVESLWPRSKGLPVAAPKRKALPAGVVEGEYRRLDHAVTGLAPSELSDVDKYHILRQCYAKGRKIHVTGWINTYLPSGHRVRRGEMDRLQAELYQAHLMEPKARGSTSHPKLRGHLGQTLAALKIVQVCNCAECKNARNGNGFSGDIDGSGGL